MTTVANRKTVAPLNIEGKEIGGVLLQGQANLWVLMTGQHLQLVELNLRKGYFHPRHNHPDHESIGFVIRGSLKMGIGEMESTLGAGDCWHHGVGVYHWTQALEDTHAVEIHSPPRPEFTSE